MPPHLRVIVKRIFHGRDRGRPLAGRRRARQVRRGQGVERGAQARPGVAQLSLGKEQVLQADRPTGQAVLQGLADQCQFVPRGMDVLAVAGRGAQIDAAVVGAEDPLVLVRLVDSGADPQLRHQLLVVGFAHADLARGGGEDRAAHHAGAYRGHLRCRLQRAGVALRIVRVERIDGGDRVDDRQGRPRRYAAVECLDVALHDLRALARFAKACVAVGLFELVQVIQAPPDQAVRGDAVPALDVERLEMAGMLFRLADPKLQIPLLLLQTPQLLALRHECARGRACASLRLDLVLLLADLALKFCMLAHQFAQPILVDLPDGRDLHLGLRHERPPQRGLGHMFRLQLREMDARRTLLEEIPPLGVGAQVVPVLGAPLVEVARPPLQRDGGTDDRRPGDLPDHRNRSRDDRARSRQTVDRHAPDLAVGLRAVQADTAAILAISDVVQRQERLHQAPQRLRVATVGVPEMADGLIELRALFLRRLQDAAHVVALVDLRRDHRQTADALERLLDVRDRPQAAGQGGVDDVRRQFVRQDLDALLDPLHHGRRRVLHAGEFRHPHADAGGGCAHNATSHAVQALVQPSLVDALAVLLNVDIQRGQQVVLREVGQQGAAVAVRVLLHVGDQVVDRLVEQGLKALLAGRQARQPWREPRQVVFFLAIDLGRATQLDGRERALNVQRPMDGRLIVAQQCRPPGAAGGHRALRHAARTVRAARAAGQGHAGRCHIGDIRHRQALHTRLRSGARQRGLAAEHALRTEVGLGAANVAFIGQDPQVWAGGPWRLYIAAAAG
uniref:Uncharacterized protein n=1 Tax=Ralstonia solanacearum TaxID=305 RepID=A0A0S4TZG8_RALSL|nr:protein of unknown function [Ralstonia solanacearum]